ncbi:MAG: L,D-transpeptidase family protein [Blautia sp.]|nr:L,D-transpeptidase family protein [Blautia sp.]
MMTGRAKKLLAALLAGGCMIAGSAISAGAETIELTGAADSPEWVKEIPEAEEAQQLFVVAGIGQTTAYISMHEKDENGAWKEIMTTPGFIGKYGLDKEREGDARTPTGTFHFNYAFGIAEDPGCALPYQQVDEKAYWSGDQREGYGYNTMVNIDDLPDLNTEDSEHILDYTYQYQYCLNISWNEDGTPGLGSAIFLHCFGPQKPYTGGCVAIPQDKMVTVMQNVKEDCVVVIGSIEDLIPSLYDEWGLAPVEETGEADDAAFDASEIYTLEDLDAASAVVLDEFATWKGCEMYSMDYAGDECCSEENLKWMNELGEGKEYTQCIEFLTDFHSPVAEEDLAGTAWEPDTTYTGYQWWLARTDGGEWELVTYGY